MEQKKLPKNEAYDQARKEFYSLRHEEEVERRIAKEEAGYVGAYFGKSRLEVGMELEDKEYDRWKSWAEAETLKAKQVLMADRNLAVPDAELGDEADLDLPTSEATETAST